MTWLGFFWLVLIAVVQAAIVAMLVLVYEWARERRRRRQWGEYLHKQGFLPKKPKAP